MQPVYKNGKTGEVEPLDNNKLENFVSNPEIDHVKVFDMAQGNKITDEQQLEAKIEEVVEKKLQQIEDKKNLKLDFERLTKHFNCKLGKLK